MAVLLQEFLPILDTLTDLRAKYGENDFGKQYSAIRGDLASAFSDLGAAEFSIRAGDIVSFSKVRVVESRHDETVPVNAILEVIRETGLELAGNTIRKAEAVISLGPAPTADDTDSEGIPEEERLLEGESEEIDQ
jgi:hypothetical protein